QLAAGVVRVVHAVDAQAQLEPQVLVVAQRPDDREEVLARDVDRQLAPEDYYLLARVCERDPLLAEHLGEDVDDLVEVAAVGPLARAGQRHRADETAEAGGVAGTAHAEHAGADVDDVDRGPLGARERALDVLGRRAAVALDVLLRHASRPFISWVGTAFSAASSALRAISRRCGPKAWSLMTCFCSSRIAWMSISGRGGQPGR